MRKKLVLFWIVWAIAVILGMFIVDDGIELLILTVALIVAAIAGALNYSDLVDTYEGK